MSERSLEFGKVVEVRGSEMICQRKTRKWIHSSSGILAYLHSQIFTKLSLPPVTNLLTLPASGLLLTKLPGTALGAQLTLLTPNPCAGNIWCVQLPESNSRTETLPSEEAQARRQPDSWGDQERRFTEAVWRLYSNIFWKGWGGVERQIRTRPS